MTKDIRIKEGSDRFKFRVGGIVVKDNKVLVVKMNENSFYCFPGGHVELFEDTKVALTRELNEELYFNVEVKNLVAINENFYKLRGDNFHELCFYYMAVPNNENINFEDKTITEQDKFGTVTHRYKWVSKHDLKDMDIKPKEIVSYIDSKVLNHFITKETN